MARQLRVTDDVCEQHMRDFELNFLFNLGGHTSVRGTTARALYNLDSTVDSREQTQKASFVRSLCNFDSDACSRILLEFGASRAAALRRGGLHVGRFHPKWDPPMARLHEYQGKAILAANGFKIPRGQAALNEDEAVRAAKELGTEVVVKIQAWTTGRAGIGGGAFAKKPEGGRAHTK